jgi:chromate transporter
MNDQTATLWDIAKLFLKLGTIAFGGPAVHVAMLQHEVVERRRWLSREEFLDHLGASNLIPGPTSTELVIHVGRKMGGWPGLLIAGACFILPAALLVGVLAWAYVRFGGLPAVSGLLYGVKPVVIAVILQALWNLGRAALKRASLVFVALVALVLTATGLNPLVVLMVGGVLAAAVSLDSRQAKAAVATTVIASVPSGSAGIVATAGLWPIFLVFLKIGAIVFRSGYVLLVFLRADLVQRLGWLTERQLLDAVAVGQVTPGPVFTTATFLGYLLHGTSGAAVATIGVFVPAFVLVAVSAPLIPKIRASRVAAAALDGINVASLALMSVVTWQLGRSTLTDAAAVAVAAVSAVTLFLFPRLNSAWLIAGAGLLGAVRYVAT